MRVDIPIANEIANAQARTPLHWVHLYRRVRGFYPAHKDIGQGSHTPLPFPRRWIEEALRAHKALREERERARELEDPLARPITDPQRRLGVFKRVVIPRWKARGFPTPFSHRNTQGGTIRLRDASLNPPAALYHLYGEIQYTRSQRYHADTQQLIYLGADGKWHIAQGLRADSAKAALLEAMPKPVREALADGRPYWLLDPHLVLVQSEQGRGIRGKKHLDAYGCAVERVSGTRWRIACRGRIIEVDAPVRAVELPFARPFPAYREVSE